MEKQDEGKFKEKVKLQKTCSYVIRSQTTKEFSQNLY